MMNERVALVWLLPLRLLVGLILVIEGWQKLSGGWLRGNQVHEALGGWLAKKRTYDFFVPFIENAYAHPKIFGTLVTLGELGIGVCLVLGLLNRPAALLGFVMMTCYALGQGQRLAPPGNALLMAAICFVFVFTSPGRIFGIDQKLRGRLAGWLV